MTAVGIGPPSGSGLSPTIAVRDDPRELLRDAMVDFIGVATSNATHAEWALAAIEAGRHVMVEKPLH
ncbi:Gfo/Idh/MocA family oxidoreductase [Sphingomonas sp. NFX23]|uniref:Gfo/Idh/MocA family oxidoreductase n=1 Tax=Sphingomonas sp. NFX23 TaxID=2819532 RepID=UPI003CE96E23